MLLFALNNWRVLLMGTIVLVLGTSMAYYRWQANRWEAKYETEKTAFQTFKSDVAAIARQAEAKAKETKARQDTTTRKVDSEYKDTRQRVSDYYGNGLRLPASDSRGRELPAAPDSAKGPDAAPAERGSGGEGVTVQACALDAAQVLAWQEWARGQGLPVD